MIYKSFIPSDGDGLLYDKNWNSKTWSSDRCVPSTLDSPRVRTKLATYLMMLIKSIKHDKNGMILVQHHTF